ncbi:uncharacterized protein V6R79_007766 [Siganus canaliculatus]
MTINGPRGISERVRFGSSPPPSPSTPPWDERDSSCCSATKHLVGKKIFRLIRRTGATTSDLFVPPDLWSAREYNALVRQSNMSTQDA